MVLCEMHKRNAASGLIGEVMQRPLTKTSDSTLLANSEPGGIPPGGEPGGIPPIGIDRNFLLCFILLLVWYVLIKQYNDLQSN